MRLITNLTKMLIVLVLSTSVAFAQVKQVQMKKAVNKEALTSSYQMEPAAKVALKAAGETSSQTVVNQVNGKMTQPELSTNMLLKTVPSSPMGTDAILWSQMTSGTFGGASQDFETAYDIYDCTGGDDFVVTGGPWNINVVRFLTFWSTGGPAVGFNIDFYSDNAGLPGANIGSYPAVAYTEASGIATCVLPSTMVLGDGTYWISINARLDYATGGQFYWYTSALPQIGYEAVWQNPGDGFATGFTTWTGIGTVWPTYTERDFAFELLDDIPMPSIAPQPYCQQVSGTYAAGGGYVMYEMYLYAGQTYNFSICNLDLCCGGSNVTDGDGDFYMYDAALTVLWYIDGASACSYNASTYGSAYEDWTPAADGYYYLVINDYYGTYQGDFTLAYSSGGAVDLAVSTSCTTVAGSFPVGGNVIYAIQMEVGSLYNFSMCNLDVCAGDYNSGGGDGDFTMLDNTGTVVFYIDGNSACGWNATTYGSAYENFSPSYNGCYYLIVDDYYGSYAGNYTLASIKTTPAAPPNDDCVNAEIVTGPYPVVGIAGTTLGSTLDCPGYLDAPGVWYVIDLPYALNTVVIDLCATTLDNCWIVAFPDCNCGSTGTYTAATWTFTPPCVYDMTWNDVPGPGAFYYNVWTGAVQSDFTLDVNVTDAIPCVVTCPPGATDENEPDIPDEGYDVTNGGCNAAPPVFQPIAIGQTYCGKANTYLFGGSNYRDTDWYRIETTSFMDLTWSGEAEFPMYLFIIDGGDPDCSVNTIIAGISADKCVPTSVSAYAVPPGTYYMWIGPSVFDGYPASTGPHDYWATLTGVYLGAPIANITPSFFVKEVDPGASTSDILNIGNVGTYTMDYTATVVYPIVTFTAYPDNAAYNTGTCDVTTFTETSIMNGMEYETGFAKFNISGIPAGSVITSVTFNGYLNANSWPYWSITSLPYDPIVAAPADMNAWIIANNSPGYSYNTESGTLPLGWLSRELTGTAVSDLQTAVNASQGWFSIGIIDWDFYAAYYVTFDGWAEANKPYLEIQYATAPALWLTIDGMSSVAGSVAPSTSNPHTVDFNSTGLPAGTYTADISVVTNEAGAKATHLIPVTLYVGYSLSGNVYYGLTTSKPMTTNTWVICTPGPTVPTGAGGAYTVRPLDNGNYTLNGSTTKPWGGLQALDAIQVQRFVSGAVSFTNLQRRAGDVNKSSSVQNLDATFIRRRVSSIAVPQWTAPEWIFDGPFGTPPALQEYPFTISGGDLILDFRTLCSGDVNGSYSVPVE